ncbi:MAG TPA: glycosyltransferase family 4 protein [Sphingomicrobium sp.]|jgi:glycosyltransferase involved in cell wall biosynthesis
MTRSKRLHVSLSIHYTGIGFTSAAVALARHMPETFEPVLYLPQVHGALPPGINAVRPLPEFTPAFIAWRPSVVAWAKRRNEENLLRAIRREGPGAVVWLWPGASTQLQRELKAAGAIVIREMINTHQGTARRVLDAEYKRLGMPPTHGITDAAQRREEEVLSLSDFVVSPSECVDASLLEWGIGEDRIIRSTFGWSPEDFAGTSKAEIPGEGIKALFVGSVGIRKGVHLALAAWDRAGVKGTFVVVGAVEPEGESLIAPYRGRDDISFAAFTRDLASLYRAADFMFFPSLEEGAPLVCYQAGGCGLPIVTGPMGQGRLVEHGVTGFVADPHDEDALASYIRTLAENELLRKEMGQRIRERALKLDFRSAAADRARAFANKGLADGSA